MSEEVTVEADVPCDVCREPILAGAKAMKTVSGPDDWNVPDPSNLVQTFLRHPVCDEGWHGISRELSDGEEFCEFYDGGTSDYILERLDDLIDMRRSGAKDIPETFRSAVMAFLDHLSRSGEWKARVEEYRP